MEQATEDFWARHGAKLNVEAFLMKQDENPRTDNGQWLHEDRVFGNTGSAQDLILPDDDYTAWPSHLTHWQIKSLVITGKDASRIFN